MSFNIHSALCHVYNLTVLFFSALNSPYFDADNRPQKLQHKEVEALLSDGKKYTPFSALAYQLKIYHVLSMFTVSWQGQSNRGGMYLLLVL